MPDDYAQYLYAARKKLEKGRGGTVDDLRHLYLRTAESIRRDIVTAAPGTLRRSHLQALAKNLELRARELNDAILKAAERGIWMGAEAGVSGPEDVASSIYLKDVFSPQDIKRLFAGINERAVLSIISRTGRDGLMLSDRVWKISDNYRRSVAKLVEEGVARGLDSRKLAKEVQQYLHPDKFAVHKRKVARRLGVSRKISHEGMRLARTELNNAFHEGMIAANQGVPSYRGIFWELSPDHPEPDVCDDMAADMSYGSPGFYPKGYEPVRPHPQCFCSTISSYEDPAAFTERLNEWRQDPGRQPDIESWYLSTGGILTRP